MRRRSGERGMTLIEIMVVMVLVGFVVAVVVVGAGQTKGARLKKTATNLTGAIKVAFTRATATSKNMRMVMDMDNKMLWLEEGDTPMLVQTKDITGTGGADPVTDAEKSAVAESDRIVKGPRAPRPFFKAVKDLGLNTDDGKRKIDSGVVFRSIQAQHDDAPRTEGRAYLYFWPGGLTERAAIQIRRDDSLDDADTLTLLVAPLTGRVTVKNGPVDMPQPRDEKEASEREDRGGF